MACQKCIDAGQAKTIHFARCGRWDTRIYCQHTYTRAKLEDNETTPGKKRIKHVISKHEASRAEKKVRRKGTPHYEQIVYSQEMDDFILQNYMTSRTHDIAYGTGQMKGLAKAFGDKFGFKHVTTNQIIGRWCRLRRAAAKKLLQQPRGTPSLPKLKFMESGI